MDLRGIEPLSEDSFIQASPITVCVLTFPLPCAHKQAQSISSFINLPQPQSFGSGVSHLGRCQSSDSEQSDGDKLRLGSDCEVFFVCVYI